VLLTVSALGKCARAAGAGTVWVARRAYEDFAERRTAEPVPTKRVSLRARVPTRPVSLRS